MDCGNAACLPKMQLLIVLVTAVLAYPNCLADVIQHNRMFKRSHWGYEGGKGNPTKWGELDSKNKVCNTGGHQVCIFNQSPIDFKDMTLKQAPKHELDWSDKLVGGVFQNNGHTLQVDVPKGNGFSLTANGTSEIYDLAQFHIHIPSEHHRYDQNFDMEMHFVSFF